MGLFCVIFFTICSANDEPPAAPPTAPASSSAPAET
jgi:hypothetical protein